MFADLALDNAREGSLSFREAVVGIECSRVPAALPEVPSSFPSTCTGLHTPMYISSFRGANVLFWLQQAPTYT